MKTILYINPLFEEIHFLIFKWENTIKKTLQKNLSTASTFPKILVDLVDTYDISEVFCVTGPGPFTLMRVVTLAINAMTYTRTIQIKSCHFFELIASGNIPIIEANPKEYLIKDNGTTMSIAKESIKKWTYEGITWWNFSTEDIKYIEYKDNMMNILHIFSLKSYETKIVPTYFKPPHITWPKLSI
jgi:hypothetical protein